MAKDLNKFIDTILQLKRFFAYPTNSGVFMKDHIATMLQYEALKCIELESKTTMGSLAVELNISLSSATQLVERLVKYGLVKRTTDKKDRRIIHLVLMVLGKKELKHFEKNIQKKIKKIFSKVPAKDLKELIRIHKNLLKNLSDPAK